MHAQKPLVHCPEVPHWALVEHVPHVPPTQAMPPPHWLLLEHAVHVPLTHASPGRACGPSLGWLQSAKVLHAWQPLLMHTCPPPQPLPGPLP